MGKVVGKITDAVGLTDISGTEKRARDAAKAQREAGMMAQFRPVGMTTRFGTSTFDYALPKPLKRKAGESDEDFAARQLLAERTQGQLTGAGYELSPELSAIQDRLFGLTGGALSDAEQARMAAMPLGAAAGSLFGLGSQYLAESPEVARQRYFDQQQALLAAPREREEERLASGVFGRGRAGLSVGDMGQPELFSLASARRQQDLALAAEAERAAQQQIGFGSSLFGQGANMLTSQYGLPGSALAPLQAYLGTIGSVEGLGQQPFELAMRLAGGQQSGQSAYANLLSAAAQTQQRGGDAASAQLTGFMNNMLNSAIGAATGGMGGFGGGGGGPTSAQIYGSMGPQAASGFSYWGGSD
jgi:hypothetical protein